MPETQPVVSRDSLDVVHLESLDECRGYIEEVVSKIPMCPLVPIDNLPWNPHIYPPIVHPDIAGGKGIGGDGVSASEIFGRSGLEAIFYLREGDRKHPNKSSWIQVSELSWVRVVPQRGDEIPNDDSCHFARLRLGKMLTAKETQREFFLAQAVEKYETPYLREWFERCHALSRFLKGKMGVEGLGGVAVEPEAQKTILSLQVARDKYEEQFREPPYRPDLELAYKNAEKSAGEWYLKARVERNDRVRALKNLPPLDFPSWKFRLRQYDWNSEFDRHLPKGLLGLGEDELKQAYEGYLESFRTYQQEYSAFLELSPGARPWPSRAGSVSNDITKAVSATWLAMHVSHEHDSEEARVKIFAQLLSQELRQDVSRASSG